MIYEFALDPELVARWGDSREWAFFREAFAWETGRVGSVYPRKWENHAIRAFFHANPFSDKDSPLFRSFEARLRTLAERGIKRESSHPELSSWLEKAEAEHHERPFHGILSLGNPRKSPSVMTLDEVYHDPPPDRWVSPPCPTPARNSQELAEAVAPLLRRCRQAVFVDPHLNPVEPRFRNVLRAMLLVLCSSRCIERHAEVEILVSEGKVGGPVVRQRFEKWLPEAIPSGISITVSVLKERNDGEKLHNRYLLTDIGGVSFGVGLDEMDKGAQGQTDDLCRLSFEQWRKRWGQYVSARHSTFDSDVEPFKIASMS